MNVQSIVPVMVLSGALVTRFPETNERLPGFEWIGSTPEAFSDHIKANIARIGKVVREAGIKRE